MWYNYIGDIMYIKTNNKKIRLEYANTFLKRFKGFMMKKNIDYCICFPKCNSIHTFFMKENIDVIMTDKNNKILYIHKDLNKNKVITHKDAYNTYEFPRNSTNFKINDIIKIETD